MATLDVLTYGFALNTDQGSFGYSTNSLLRTGGHNILIDTGPSSRRPFLYRALTNMGLTTDDIDIVILTHMHWDHCQNTDLFRNARVLVNPVEIDYARNPNSWDLAVAAGMADMMRNMKVEVVSEGDTIVDGVSILETPGPYQGTHERAGRNRRRECPDRRRCLARERNCCSRYPVQYFLGHRGCLRQRRKDGGVV